jgi:hypothetical protein
VLHRPSDKNKKVSFLYLLFFCFCPYLFLFALSFLLLSFLSFF